MKKILMLSVLGLFIFTNVIISVSNQSSEEKKPYDEDTYGPEASIIWTIPVKSVIFSHKEHTIDAELNCESCHDELFEMETGAAEKNDNFTMEAMGEGLYCGACHDDNTAFAYDGQCAYCHIAPEKLVVWTKPVKAVVFSHLAHTVEIGLDCESCHNDLFIMKNGTAEKNDDFTMKSLYERNYCGVCHDSNNAFAADTRCTACHIGVRGYMRLMGNSEGSVNGTGHN